MTIAKLASIVVSMAPNKQVRSPATSSETLAPELPISNCPSNKVNLAETGSGRIEGLLTCYVAAFYLHHVTCTFQLLRYISIVILFSAREKCKPASS